MNPQNRTYNALQSNDFTVSHLVGETLKHTINYAALIQSATISASTWTSDTATIASPAVVGKTTTANITASVGCNTIFNTITTSAGEVIKIRINLTGISYSEYISGDYND